MRFTKFSKTMSCLGLTVCIISQTAFVSLAAGTVQPDTGVAGVSVALTGYMNSDEEKGTTFGLGNILKSGIGFFMKEEESDVSLYENLAISKVANYVNIRSEANTEAEVLGKIYDQCAATILETVEQEDGTWYKIKSGSVTGYIKAEFFVTGFEAETYAKENAHMFTRATAGGLRVREEASLTADVVARLEEGDTCTVLEEGSEFVKVRTEDGTEGYVYAEYVEIFIKCDEAISIEEERAMIEEQRRLEEEARRQREAEEAARRQAEEEARRRAEEEERRRQEEAAQQTQTQAPTQAPETQAPTQAPETQAPETQAPSNNSGVSAARQTVVNFALSKVGMEYVWGGDGAHEGGYDCSGLVKAAYAQVGVNLPRYSGDQGRQGSYRSLSEAQPGDILWRNGHVGIYIGDGKYVHASTYGVGVIVSNLSSSGFTCARNVLG